MKPPVRPDVPAESTQPVQPAQPVQTSQHDYKAKPVQPAHPIQQVKRTQQDQQPVQLVHQSLKTAHQPKQSAGSLTQSEKYPQSKIITLSPNHSVPTTFPHIENGTARPLSPVRVYATCCHVYIPVLRVCRLYWITLMDNNCCLCSVSLRNLF